MDAKPLKPTDDYKTFSELAEYARQRAKISAARNGHQEFAYWLMIAEWADDCQLENKDPHDALKTQVALVEWRDDPRVDLSIDEVAEHYAKAVHARKLLKNRGEKVKRLSLAWLREAALGL